MDVEKLRDLVLDALDRAGLNVQPINARGNGRLPGVLVLEGGHAVAVVCADAELRAELRPGEQTAPHRWRKRKA